MSAQGYEIATELGQLSAAISGGATSLVLRSGQGSSFDTDFPYDIRIGGDSSAETVTLSAVSTDTLTVSATAGAWPEGTAVFMIAALTQPRQNGTIALTSDISGGGGISGPGASTDRAIATWNGTGGTALRNNAPLIASDGRITTVTDPTGDQDAVNLRSVAAQIVALVSSRRAVRLVTVAALPSYTRSSNTITATANGALSVDGVSVASGDRILNRHGTGADRGIFTVTATGSGGAPYVLDRATDADAAGDLATGQIVNVTAGSTRVGAAYYLSTTGAITLNTTTLTYDPLVPPRGSARNVQYRDDSTTEQEGAANLAIDAGGYPTVGPVTGTTALATPSTGLTHASRYRAGMDQPGWLGRRGREILAQRSLIVKPVWFFHNGNAASVTASNTLGDWTLGGTGQARNVATSAFGQHRRIGIRSATADNNAAGLRATSPQFFRGTSAGLGGFFWAGIWGCAASTGAMRAIAGLQSVSTFGSVTSDPSAQTNCAAFMADSGETEYRFGTNDASGSCTRTSSFGASFPINTASADMYLGMIYVELGVGSDIYYSLENLITGALAEGSVSSDLPANTALLAPVIAFGNGVNTPDAATDLDISLIYCSMEL